MNIFKRKKSYIEYDNNNNQWNDGFIYVYVKDNLIQSFYVNDLREHLEEFDESFSVYNFIDDLKKMYNIKEVIVKEHNWR